MLSSAVRLILKNSDGEFLFLLQTKRNGGKFSLVGGTVERNEFSRDTLCREAKEEIGINIQPEDLQLVHTMHRQLSKKGDAMFTLFFHTPRYFGVPISLEPKKFQRVEWIGPKKLPKNISPMTRLAIKKILNNESYSEYRDKIVKPKPTPTPTPPSIETLPPPPEKDTAQHEALIAKVDTDTEQKLPSPTSAHEKEANTK